MAIFLKAKWENIVMANYPIAQEILLPYLPKGVELDLYDGKAYISLVGFMFKQTKLFNIPIPYLGTFEEINLRFYVLLKEGDKVKRGVVFINETIPYKLVAWMANALYKEHYTTVPTRNSISLNELQKNIKYYWQKDNKWNSIEVEAASKPLNMDPEGFEYFIYEHFFGYTKIDMNTTEEYQLHHPSWLTNTVTCHKIDCDFKAMYGHDFEILNSTPPSAVFLAEGSQVEVEWKRTKLKFNAGQ